MIEEDIKEMKKVLKQQWGDTDNLVNDALCYIDRLEEENKELKEEVKRVKFILSGHWEEYEKDKK